MTELDQLRLLTCVLEGKADLLLFWGGGPLRMYYACKHETSHLDWLAAILPGAKLCRSAMGTKQNTTNFVKLLSLHLQAEVRNIFMDTASTHTIFASIVSLISA